MLPLRSFSSLVAAALGLAAIVVASSSAAQAQPGPVYQPQPGPVYGQPYPPPQPYPPQPYPPQPYPAQPYPPAYGTAPPPGYAYPPPQPPPPPADPPPSKFYGWEILPGAGLVTGLFFLGKGTEGTDGKVVVYTAATVTALIWGPLVHRFNGESSKSKLSSELVVAGALVGAMFGAVAASQQKEENREYGHATLLGLEVGIVSAMVIDGLVFGWTGDDKKDASGARPPRMHAIAAPITGGASLGLGGTF